MKNSDIDWKAGDTAIIRPSWSQGGIELKVLGGAIYCGGQWWVPVQDSDDEDPTFYKEAALEKKP